jgi:hypothetical protein
MNHGSGVSGMQNETVTLTRSPNNGGPRVQIHE